VATKDELGRRGERIAEAHLVGLGLRVLDRNWRCPIGELDLVLLDGDEVVFAEVKTRSGLGFGHPFEALHPAKLARLRRLAGAWCEAHDRGGPIRLDAVAVIAIDGRAPEIEHLAGIG